MKQPVNNPLIDLASQAVAAYDVDDQASFQRTILQLESFSLTHAPKEYGDVLHLKHILSGLFALRVGDKDSAILALLKAGKVPSAPVLKSFGPNMLLAQELLEAGEPEAVLQYLQFCKAFWALPFYLLKVPKWEKAIKRGVMPQFGAHLIYHISWELPIAKV